MNIYIKNDAEIQAIAKEGKVHGIGNILDVFDNRPRARLQGAQGVLRA